MISFLSNEVYIVKLTIVCNVSLDCCLVWRAENKESALNYYKSEIVFKDSTLLSWSWKIQFNGRVIDFESL